MLLLKNNQLCDGNRLNYFPITVYPAGLYSLFIIYIRIQSVYEEHFGFKPCFNKFSLKDYFV